MKTKAIILKFVAALVLIAMVNTVSVAQRNGADKQNSYISLNYPAYTKIVVVENNMNIQDWMLDDLAFVFRSEDARVEDWMVRMEDGSEIWQNEEYLSTDWMFDADYNSTYYLVDWMVEEHAYIGYDYSESLSDLNMMDWMLEDHQFILNNETEPVELQKWMLNVDGNDFAVENEVSLQSWMLDQRLWN